MKKLLLIALLLSFATGTAIAQKGGSGSPAGMQGHSGNTQIERLTDQLGLDEAQAAEIALIFEDVQMLRDEERERMRAMFEEQRTATHALIMEALNPEQQALFEELQQRRDELRQALKDMGMFRGNGGSGGGPGTGDCSG